MEKMNPEVKADDDMKWVHDSSVDHKGRVPLRASTGSWKAAFFIIGKKNINCFSFILIIAFK